MIGRAMAKVLRRNGNVYRSGDGRFEARHVGKGWNIFDKVTGRRHRTKTLTQAQLWVEGARLMSAPKPAPAPFCRRTRTTITGGVVTVWK